MEYDDVLTLLGRFGRYQKWQFCLLSLPQIAMSFHMLGYVFWAAVPTHWCALPPNSMNLTHEQMMRIFIPMEERGGQLEFSQCMRYSYNHGEIPAYTLGANGSLLLFGNASQVPCTSWEYDRSTVLSSIVTEWDLVCGRKWMMATAQSVYLVGIIVGSPLAGYAADRFGRLKTLTVCSVLQFVVSVVSSFIPNYVVFLIFRFVLAIVASGMYNTSYVIVMEIVGPKNRVFCANILMCIWATGYLIVAGIGYLFRDRLSVQLALSLPCAVLVMYPWVIGETSRWLFVNGKETEAMDNIRLVAKWNRVDLPENLKVIVKKESQTQSGILDLLRGRNMRLKTIIMMFLWTSTSSVYYGLTLNADKLGSNQYLGFLISGAVEFPAYIWCLFTQEKWGRRWPLSFALLLAGACLLINGFLPQGLQALSITLAMLGKMAMSASYDMVFLYAVEVFPTVTRSVGLGTCNMAAKVGSATAPYSALLMDISRVLPFLIFGGVAAVAGTLALALPETHKTVLPASVEDGERIPLTPLHQMCCRQRKKNRPQNAREDTGTDQDKLTQPLNEEKQTSNHIDV